MALDQTLRYCPWCLDFRFRIMVMDMVLGMTLGMAMVMDLVTVYD